MTTLLIIDKNSSTAFRTKKALAGKPVEVISALSADEALAKSYKNLDIIVVDVNLGNDDGFELIKKFYEINPDVRVIVVTASNTRKDFVRGVRLGINDYILKPYDDIYFQKKMLLHVNASEPQPKVDVEAILYDAIRHSILSKQELLVGLLLVYHMENPIRPVVNVPLVKGFYSKMASKVDFGITDLQLTGKVIPYQNNGRVVILENAKLSEKQNVIKYFEKIATEYFEDSNFRCELEFINLPHEVPQNEKILPHLTKLIERNLETNNEYTY